MLGTEFWEWVSIHKGYFPGIDRWLDEMEEKVRDSWMENARDFLREITFSAAKQASRDMYEADKEPAFGQHLKVVKRLALAIMSEKKEAALAKKYGKGLIRCMDCLDEGVTSVWVVYEFDPTAGKKVSAAPEDLISHVQEFGPMPGYRTTRKGGTSMLTTAGVCCDCEAGTRAVNLSKLDRSWMVIDRGRHDAEFWQSIANDLYQAVPGVQG